LHVKAIRTQPKVKDSLSISKLFQRTSESIKLRESEENGMENRKVGVSFKALYDAGITNLHYGGYIDYYNEDGEREYYDLRRDEDGSLLYCDGDIFILKEEKFYFEGCKDTEMYCLVHAETQLPLYLSKKEYDIAVFENKEKPEKPIYSIEKLYVQNDMLKKIAIKAIQRCLGCESELAVYDGLEDYLKSLTGYSKSAVETLLEHSFDAIKQE